MPLGFNNTYALALRADDARAKGIARLSDLKAHPELRLGLSQEFIGRADGWPGLKQTYDLPFATPRGLDHGLAYEAIAQKQVDVIDIYSTDAKIDKYGLTVLADDRHYFPPLRRRAALSGGSAAAAAEDLAGARAARGQHRRRVDAAHERGRGAGRQGLRVDCRGFHRATCRRRQRNACCTGA